MTAFIIAMVGSGVVLSLWRIAKALETIAARHGDLCTLARTANQQAATHTDCVGNMLGAIAGNMR